MNLQNQCAEDLVYENPSVLSTSTTTMPINAFDPFSSHLFPLFSLLVACTLLLLLYPKRQGLLKTLGLKKI